MSDRSAIEWTDATWNPIRAVHATPDGPKYGWHCEHVSEGCRRCYAESFNRWVGTGFDYKPGHLLRPGPHHGDMRRGDVSLFLDEKMLLLPLKWKRPRKVFVGSMTDVFADFVTDEWRDRMFAVMALCPQHVFQVLTKRPQRMRAYLGRPDVSVRVGLEALGLCCEDAAANSKSKLGAGILIKATDINPGALQGWPLSNVWLGTTAEDRPALLDRVGHLRQTPAAVRFLSCEPMIGDLGHVVLSDIDWVICGGESGPGARPMHPDWARSLRDQCAAAGVPFFFKQWGAWAPVDMTFPLGKERHHFSSLCEVSRVGKKAAGRLLDGAEHDGMPEVARG